MPEPVVAYLDHAASTPMRPSARVAVADALEQFPGNPSGQHRSARAARRALDDAREQVATAVGADPGGVVFTSGGTEADNLAIAGSVGVVGGAAVCLATDHHAVLEPVRRAGGAFADVDRFGVVDLDALDAQLANLGSVAVVSLAVANNELGVIQPIEAAAEVVRRRAPGATLHLDAVASAAWVDLAPLVAVADLVTVSGHKLGGPKGIGALVVGPGTRVAPQLVGGPQERERRAGTPNLAGAIGLGVAMEEATSCRAETSARVAAMRELLAAGLRAELGELIVEVAGPEAVASGVEVAPNVVHLCARGVHRDALQFRLDEDGVLASAGASCASGATEPSHVLDAVGVPAELQQGALRLSLGWCTTDAEIAHALSVVPQAIADLQGTADGGAGR